MGVNTAIFATSSRHLILLLLLGLAQGTVLGADFGENLDLEFGGVAIEDYSHVQALEPGTGDLAGWTSRRLALEAEVQAGKRLELVMDVAWDEETGEFEWRDAYLALDLPDRFDLRLGQMKQNFGFSRTSSLKSQWTLERPLPLDLLQLERTVGVQLEKGFDNSLLELSYFRDETEDGEPIDSYIARYVYAFDGKDGTYWHAGASLAREDYDGANYRVRSRGEIDAGDNLLRTEKIRAQWVDYAGINVAWQRGRLALVSELLVSDVYSPREGDRHYAGGYAQASWMLTADSHRFDEGQLKSLVPAGRVALELTGTLATVDVWSRDDGYSADTRTIAFNAYYTSHWKLMTELTWLNVWEGDHADRDRGAALMRLQYRF